MYNIILFLLNFLILIQKSSQNKCNFKTGVKLIGNNIDSAYLGLTINECCKKCLETPACQAYTFKNELQSECMLKYAIGSGFHADLKCISGVVQRKHISITTLDSGVIEIENPLIYQTINAQFLSTSTKQTTKKALFTATKTSTTTTTTTTTTTKTTTKTKTTTTLTEEINEEQDVEQDALEQCKKEANVRYGGKKSNLDLLSIVSIDADSCCFMCGLINECVGFNYIREIPKCLLVSKIEHDYRIDDVKYDFYSRT